MQKWLVDVQCEGCRGLFYRSAPNVIVPDADWPRNGDVVMGYEIDTPGKSCLRTSRDTQLICLLLIAVGTKLSFGFACIVAKGWIRLQNGYYLPIRSDDDKVQFLHKVSKRAQTQNTEMKRIGSNTPLFRGAGTEQGDMASLLGGNVAVVDVAPVGDGGAEEVNGEKNRDSLRAAVHMDAMAFGMGCCCLQITFQAKDVDESRFIFDQLAVLAPM